MKRIRTGRNNIYLTKLFILISVFMLVMQACIVLSATTSRIIVTTARASNQTLATTPAAIVGVTNGNL